MAEPKVELAVNTTVVLVVPAVPATVDNVAPIYFILNTNSLKKSNAINRLFLLDFIR